MGPRGESWTPDMAANKENQEGEAKPEKPPTVPDGEIHVDFVRSSGPGGQNVNKTSTKAQLRWCVGVSATFSEEEKVKIRAYAGNRLNGEDEIVISADTERSQPQNRKEAVERLQQLVVEALTERKERKATKPSRGAKERRLDEKRRQGDRKRNRRSGTDGNE